MNRKLKLIDSLSCDIYCERTMLQNEKTIFAILAPCILTLKKTRIYYKGSDDDTPEWRIVHPYLIGENQKGNAVLSAYDTSGQKHAWKTYLLSNIIKVEALNEVFLNDRTEFNRNDKRMKSILCCIPETE